MLGLAPKRKLCQGLRQPTFGKAGTLNKDGVAGFRTGHCWTEQVFLEDKVRMQLQKPPEPPSPLITSAGNCRGEQKFLPTRKRLATAQIYTTHLGKYPSPRIKQKMRGY